MSVKNIATFLLQNTGIRQTVIKNTFWLGLSEVISRLLEFALIIYITRMLGPTEFGKFAFVLAFVSVFGVVSDFGLTTVATREFSGEKQSQKEYSAILSLKIIFSIVALLLMLVSSFFITSDPIIWKLIWILALFALIHNFFFIIYAFLRARQQMQYEALIKIFKTIITVLLGFIVIFNFPSIINVGYGYLIANLIALSFMLLFVHFHIFHLRLSFDKALLQKFFKFSWPLGIAAVAGVIFINIDSVIMGHLGKITEVGWYNVAKIIVSFAIIPSTLMMMSFYPLLSKFFKDSKENLQKTWNYYMELMIVLALPITVGGFILASKIINLMYGPSFSPSISIFQILIFSAGISLLHAPYLTIMIVSGQQKKYLWLNVIAAITNIVLNFALIPMYGPYGAAIVTIITYLIILFGALGITYKTASVIPFNLRLCKITLMVMVASLVMSLVISWSLIYNFNTIIMILIGILTYFVVLSSFYKLLFTLNLLPKNL